MSNRKSLTPYDRKMLDIIDAYVEETGVLNIEMRMVAAWGVQKGLWEAPKRDLIKQLSRDLSRAARQDFIEDENGEPVRRRHAYRIQQGETQQTWWFYVEAGTPQQMRLSAQQRRRGILADCVQLHRDVSYYNNHHNPGDPIQPSFNFEQDIAEKASRLTTMIPRQRRTRTDWSFFATAPPRLSLRSPAVAP